MAKGDDYLAYDWNIEGQRARFLVNMAVEPHAPDPSLPILLYVNCASGDSEQGLLKASELHRIDRITDKIAKKLKLLFVGSIELPEQKQLYYYAPDTESLDRLEAYVSRKRGLFLAADLAKEPKWTTYWNLLYPDAAKYQTILNREIAARLEKNGDYNVAARRVNFMVYFPTEQLRINFSEEARLGGFAVGLPRFRPERECAYGVALHKITALLPEQIDEATTKIIRMAARYEGEMEGWDCQPISRNNPFR
ncbi:MAG: DUF695 domain-containing protein [Bacillota bacterium]